MGYIDENGDYVGTQEDCDRRAERIADLEAANLDLQKTLANHMKLVAEVARLRGLSESLAMQLSMRLQEPAEPGEGEGPSG